MSVYRVKSLSVGGKGNKIFNSGDLVTQANFAAKVEELEKGGYLEKVEDKVPEDAETEADKLEAIRASEYKKLSKADVVTTLLEAGKEFDDKATKAELYELWKETLEEV